MKKYSSRGYALATQFRQQLAKVKPQTAIIKLAIPEIAVDFVFEFEAQRPNVQSMLVAGVLPESLARTILEINSPDAAAKVAEDAAEEVDRMSVEEQIRLFEFQRKIAIETCVNPKLVFRDVIDPNEIDLRTVPFADKLISALYRYGMTGLAPGVPVATMDGGETTVAAVETFPDGAELPNDRDDGQVVSQAAE
jgi:hypothetical protein